MYHKASQSLVFLFVILTVSSPETHATDARTYRYDKESEVIKSADGRIYISAARPVALERILLLADCFPSILKTPLLLEENVERSVPNS